MTPLASMRLKAARRAAEDYELLDRLDPAVAKSLHGAFAKLGSQAGDPWRLMALRRQAAASLMIAAAKPEPGVDAGPGSNDPAPTPPDGCGCSSAPALGLSLLALGLLRRRRGC